MPLTSYALLKIGHLKLKIAMLAVLAGSVFGWTISPVFAATRADTAAIKVVRLKFEAFNRHDAESIEEIYANTASLHSPDYPDLTGSKQIADTYRKLFEAIPDAKDNLQTLESSANHVYAQFVLTGHLKGAEDKPISVRILSVYTVRAGRIVGDSTYYDRKM